jgi:DNA-binding MarR family transcriptional regulator
MNLSTTAQGVPSFALISESSNDPMSSEKPAKDLTPERCAAQLMETVPLVMRFIRSEMRSQSSSLLSVPQFRALGFLDRNPGSSLSDLADHLGVTRPTASAMTERLVQRGFVDRADHPQQRRQIVLKLTHDGTTYLNQMRQNTRTKIADLLTALSDEQLSEIAEGLSIIGQVFGAEQKT